MWELSLMNTKIDRLNSDVCNLLIEKTTCQNHNDTAQQVNYIRNFEELDDFIEKSIRGDYKGKSHIEFLREYVLDFDSFTNELGSKPPDCSPFINDYRLWEMTFFEFLSGKKYNVESEGVSEDWIKKYAYEKPPTINWSTSEYVSRMKIYIEFLEICMPMADMHILEMGSGMGYLLELFGRRGCHVTGIEISEAFAEYSRNLLQTQHISNEIICCSYYEADNLNKQYDIVVFDASFHHCHDPMSVLKMLYAKVSDEGSVFFLNEPIHDNYDRPWGVVRYDGESLLQIRALGWLEFGYRADFFAELLCRAGFNFVSTHDMSNGSKLFVARKKVTVADDNYQQ